MWNDAYFACSHFKSGVYRDEVFLKPTRKTVRGKTYTNHLLVESISTPNGPRHRTICSLGSLEPAPASTGWRWRTNSKPPSEASAGDDLLGRRGKARPHLLRRQRGLQIDRPAPAQALQWIAAEERVRVLD